MTRCSRDRIVVDTYVKVNVSDWTDLLVYSPAIEEQYNWIKTKVEKVNDGYDYPPVYVGMDDKKQSKKFKDYNSLRIFPRMIILNLLKMRKRLIHKLF